MGISSLNRDINMYCYVASSHNGYDCFIIFQFTAYMRIHGNLLSKNTPRIVYKPQNLQMKKKTNGVSQGSVYCTSELRWNSCLGSVHLWIYLSTCLFQTAIGMGIIIQRFRVYYWIQVLQNSPSVEVPELQGKTWSEKEAHISKGYILAKVYNFRESDHL